MHSKSCLLNACKFCHEFFFMRSQVVFHEISLVGICYKKCTCKLHEVTGKKKHLMEPYSIYRYTYNTKYQCNCKERCYIVHVNVQSINVWHYCTALSLIYCLFWGRMMPWFLASDFVSVYHQILKRQYSILITNNNDK
jgi:hypothetical protein